MARGASFHLKPVRAPAVAFIHNTRVWTDEHPAPAYLLPDECSLGHWREVTRADPETVHAQKMAMASGKARAMAAQGDYSPVWEGVLNLPHPAWNDSDRATMGAMVRAFVEGYERITGHRVLTADIHLDEGRIEPDGTTILNPHAHIVVDRTDARGRPIRLDKDQLRAVQDLAAATTGLDRGEDAAVTRRRHLSHQAYRGLARAGRVQSREDVEEARQIAEEARTTAELYGELRGLLKATGRATQVDYQTAKAKREDRAWIEQQIAALERALQVQRDQAQKTAEAERQAREAAEREAIQARLAAAAAAARPPVVEVREVVREVIRTGVYFEGKEATPAELIERISNDGRTIQQQAEELAELRQRLRDDRWRVALNGVATYLLGLRRPAPQALWTVAQVYRMAGEPVPMAVQQRYRQITGRGVEHD